jgi:ABC-type uncharacterized transport system permease subunit
MTVTELLSGLTFAVAVLLYGGASTLFYLDVARVTSGAGPRRRPPAGGYREAAAGDPKSRDSGELSRGRLPPTLLTFAALGHAAYVAQASFIAHVCPIHSIHFLLSVASLFASASYLTLRTRFRIDALGLLVAPLGLAFLLGTYFLGKPAPEPRLSPWFITFHVLSNLIGVGLFLLAGGAAALYLVQERRIKEKRRGSRMGNLPPLDTLDAAEHRFLVYGFPLLTLGVVTGTYWAQKLESGSPDEVMRTVFGYATWLLIGGVLLLRAAAGWRGRRSAYGTILGLFCATAVMIIYLARPSFEARHGGPSSHVGGDPQTPGPAGHVGGDPQSAVAITEARLR